MGSESLTNLSFSVFVYKLEVISSALYPAYEEDGIIIGEKPLLHFITIDSNKVKFITKRRFRGKNSVSFP